MDPFERTHKSILPTIAISVICCILFSYFMLFSVWDINNYLLYLQYLYLLYASIVTVFLCFLYIRAKKYLYHFFVLKNYSYIAVLLTLIIGCGGVWFYFFSAYAALAANAIIVMSTILVAKKRLSSIDKIVILGKVESLMIKDIDNNKYSFDNKFYRLERVKDQISYEYRSKSYKVIYSFFTSVASILSFLLLGISISLDRLGYDVLGIIFINIIFYFAFILFSVSNDVIANVALNNSLLEFLKDRKKTVTLL